MSFSSKLRALLTLGRGLATGLPDATVSSDPIELFDDWFGAAKRSGILLPEAMSLATASADGTPSVRMVLLKAFGDDGFVFYTNYDSRKAREIEANPVAALAAHWPVLQRQVRIEGPVARVPEDVSDAYFSTRARGSQLGALVSEQSAVINDRASLEGDFERLRAEFEGADIPRPKNWGGYSIRATRIEFWQGRPDRLHDRIVFDRTASGGWSGSRLAP